MAVRRAASGQPYPVLAIAGEQGSAKTVLSKHLWALLDPSVAPVRALPRDERELFIAASNGHVLTFDNLGGLPPWLSDTLCRLTSDGAFFHTSAVQRSRRNSFAMILEAGSHIGSLHRGAFLVATCPGGCARKSKNY